MLLTPPRLEQDAPGLGGLLQKFGRGWRKIQEGASKTQLSGASSSSSRAAPGFVFFALKGSKTHGASFLPQILRSRPAIVLVEPPCPAGLLKILHGPGSSKSAAYFAPALRSQVGEISSWIYGDPSLRLPVVAVTGTNGKTTACYMLEAIAEAAGKSSGVLGTIASRIAGQSFPAHLTTPQADELFFYLARMLESGCSYAFIEATSQAIDLGRLKGLKPAGAVFTNLTRDHLDYHKTMLRYYQAKEKLFTETLVHSPWPGRFAVLNGEDSWGVRLKKQIQAIQPVTFGLAPGRSLDWSAERIAQSFEGASFILKAGGKNHLVRLKLFGRHNVLNALAAAASAHGLGLGMVEILAGLQNLKEVPGRLQKVPSPKNLLVLVDYAHTDDALAHALKACREIPGVRRLVVIFGCGGDRDSGKRPLMGQAAVQLADFAVVTSDNPRSEDPEVIIGAIEKGIKAVKKTNYTRITDRREAIHWTLSRARRGDCILIAGKGHETYQILGNATIRFDDREVAAEALATRRPFAL